MPFLQIRTLVTSAALVALLSPVSVVTQGQQEPAAPAAPTPPIMQASPLLSAIDVNHDGKIDASELADAPARLRTLDKNGDGKLTRDEGALPAGYGRVGGPAARQSGHLRPPGT